MDTTELIIKTLATQNKLLQARVKELEGILEKRLETNVALEQDITNLESIIHDLNLVIKGFMNG